MGHTGVAVDVGHGRGADPSNPLAAEPVPDQHLDDLDHALEVLNPLSHGEPHVNARRWPADIPGRYGQRNDGNMRRQMGSRGWTRRSRAKTIGGAAASRAG